MLDGLLYRQQKFWRSHGFTILLLAITAYFVSHSFSGNRGYFSYLETSEELAASKQRLAALVAVREELDQTIEGLEPHRIDPDLLEDYLRMHGYIRDSEVILLPDD